MPVSRISGTTVRLSRTEPTTWSPARMAQVASPTGPLSPLRRLRWKPFNHAIRAGDHSSPIVTGGVTSLAAASVIAALTSRSKISSSTSRRVTAGSSAALTAQS